jgi:hypothetical protein
MGRLLRLLLMVILIGRWLLLLRGTGTVPSHTTRCVLLLLMVCVLLLLQLWLTNAEVLLLLLLLHVLLLLLLHLMLLLLLLLLHLLLQILLLLLLLLLLCHLHRHARCGNDGWSRRDSRGGRPFEWGQARRGSSSSLHRRSPHRLGVLIGIFGNCTSTTTARSSTTGHLLR